MRDESYFHDSEAFRPERFLEPLKGGRDGPAALNEHFNDDPSSVVFGFGRRYDSYYSCIRDLSYFM